MLSSGRILTEGLQYCFKYLRHPKIGLDVLARSHSQGVKYWRFVKAAGI